MANCKITDFNKKLYPPLGKNTQGGSWLDSDNCQSHNIYQHYQRNLTNSSQNYSINRGIINNSQLPSGQMPGQYQSSSSDSLFSSGRHTWRHGNQFKQPLTQKLVRFANAHPGNINNKQVTNQSFKMGKLSEMSKSSSSYIDYKRNKAIGKSSFSRSSTNIAFSGANKNDENHARRKMRSSGSRSPPKTSIIKDRVSCSYSCQPMYF